MAIKFRFRYWVINEDFRFCFFFIYILCYEGEIEDSLVMVNGN